MKILHVITCSDRAGAQMVVSDLALNLPDGYRAIVAAGEDGFLKESCEAAGVPFFKVRGLVRQIAPFRDLIALFSLVSLIRRQQPDVVHSHTSKAGIVARVAAWITGTPSVFTAHTWSFDDGLPPLQRWLSIPMEKFVGMLGGTIITVSDANTRKALRRAIAPSHRIVRIWLGIPNSARVASPGSRSEARIVMVARFVEQKDQALLLRALAGATGSWRLQLVGDGPLLEPAKLLADELGLTSRVQFLGARNDVDQLLAEADVFVLASRWEGLPVSILEAMRAGLPVVACDVGGVSEMVRAGANGLLSPPGDAARLRENLQGLIDSPQLCAAMGRASRERFEQDFRLESSVMKNVAVYDAVTARSGGQRLAGREECAR